MSHAATPFPGFPLTFPLLCGLLLLARPGALLVPEVSILMAAVALVAARRAATITALRPDTDGPEDFRDNSSSKYMLVTVAVCISGSQEVVVRSR